MATNDSILGIDIGAWSIKIGEFENTPSGVIMRKFAYIEYPETVNDDNREKLIREALQKIIAENNFQSKNACISLSGQLAFTRFVALPPIEEDEARVRQVVEFEARQNVPFEMDEVIWDYQLIAGGDDGLDVMFVVIKNEIVEQITDAVEANGLKTRMVDVAPSTCYNSARANQIGDDSCAMILSIGARCSNLIFVDGEKFFSRNIPIAGYAITQQVAKEFGISNEEAEELKLRHGFVALGGAYEEPESEVAATISKIVRNVMTRLHGEINRSINIYRSQQKGNKPTKMYLAGGSSIMAFTETFFQEKLRLDVEYLNPFQVIKLDDTIDRQMLAEKAHIFSEVIGMAMRNYRICPVEISLLPEKIKNDMHFKSKKPYFYASALLAVTLPALFLIHNFRAKNHYEKEVKKRSSHIKMLSNTVNYIDKEINNKNVKFEQFKKLQKDLDKRLEWIYILKNIESSIPQGVWISEIEPIVGNVEESIAKSEGEESNPMKSLSLLERLQLKRQKKLASTKVIANETEIGGVTIKGYAIVLSEDKDIILADDFVKKLKSRALRDKEIRTIKDIELFSVDSKKTHVKYLEVTKYDNLKSFEIVISFNKPVGKGAGE